jgi:putative FmdB family regulatory protein
MPLYEYQCVQCSEREEVIQRHDAPPPAQCAKCGGGMKKLISAPAIQFKGSGFYKNDYAAKPAASSTSSTSESKSESKSESTSESKSDAKSETRSESKPETKSENKAETKSETKSATKAGD